MPEGREWSPEDLLIHDEFCPIEQIEASVERARKRAGAGAALLLVADEWVVLRTLCVCVPDDGDDESKLTRMRALLAEVSLLPRKPAKGTRKRSSALQDYVKGPRPGDGRERFPATAGKVLEELAAIARRIGDEELDAWLSEGLDAWVPARVPERMHGSRLSTALLFYEPREEVVGEGEVPVTVVDADVIDIAVRVSSTAHANVRRDNLIMKRLDRKLDPADYISGSVDFEAAATSLVELAVEVSGSDAGACYLVDHSKKSFERMALKMEGEVDRRWAYPRELALDDHALAAAATTEHRALQLPPGIFGRPVRPTVVRLGGGRPDLVELATPLPGPLAAPKAPAVGVLSVVKIAEPGAFGAYETSVVRNVALRLALIANTTNATKAAQMFARLSKRATGLPRTPSARGAGARPVDGIALPDDVLQAMPAIEDALSTVGAVTRAETATFRAALPSGASRAPHGLTLARVAAHPAALAGGPEHALQPESEGGYNWRAVRSGEISNVPVVTSGDRVFSRHRPNTRSELSVPVYVEERVVGVVNLESPVEHAFDAHVEVAQAAAEHIGLAIANARLALSIALQELAIEVIRNAHSIEHLPESFMERVEPLPAAEAERVTAIASEIGERLEGLRTVSPDEDSLLPDGDLSFPSLVRHAVGEMRADIHYEDGPWPVHEPAVARAIAKALGDVLDNAIRHRADKAPPPRLTMARDRWGGQGQDVLAVRCMPDEVRRPEEAVNVYRCPLGIERRVGEEDDVPVGAYLAGLQVRRIGGELHLAYERRSQARVVLAIPSAGGRVAPNGVSG